MRLADRPAGHHNLVLAAAGQANVPFWYGENRVGGKNFTDEVLKRVDAVTVMSDRDTATGPNSVLDVS
jgi:hypothetical protein